MNDHQLTPITEYHIDGRTWLEPVPCFAPVYSALWYSSETGWAPVNARPEADSQDSTDNP